ncbi:hypothetical protein [Fibrobacter sp.]|uniref:hypothetical protein n=1 Tax=Fibrobacter sp. TaxID=35828 RepID=UPI00388E5E97
MKKILKEIFGKLELDDWVFVAIPVVLFTPGVIYGFCNGETDTALGLLVGELFFVVLLILAPTLHDKMYG